MNSKVQLDGENLTIEDIENLAENPSVQVEIAEKTLAHLDKVRKFVDESSKDQIIYGVNTGFGPMASRIIGRDQLHDLQQNLIRSHAVGFGEPIRNDFVLAAMVIRLNTLVKGYSGISRELAIHLQGFINHRIIPVVPEHGAVGTSGDLVQLAHIALALIGEGEVFYKNGIRKTSEVLESLKISPYTLRPKEGLSLINGTSVMSGIASILSKECEKLLNLAVINGSWSLEMVNGFADSISESLHDLRPHRGQVSIAQEMRKILSSSKLLKGRHSFSKSQKITEEVHEIPEDVQDIYSLRCIPQILGPVSDSIKTLRDILSVEINSVTDNPIVNPDSKESPYLHGGNFHGDYVAYAVDQLKMTIVKLTMLSERRINYFLNHRINRRFPPFINLDTPGITLALQALQFVATSTTSQNQTLAFPQYVHSISTNADNQDVVSMGTDAALLLNKVIENAFIVITIEAITLAQAVDYMKTKDQLSEITHIVYKTLREIFPVIIKDRVLIDDIRNISQIIRFDLHPILKKLS